jgi:hypothetical protein
MSRDPSIRHGVLSHSDTWLGIVIAASGGVAAYMASGFDAISRTYPLSLGVLLVALGLSLIVKGLRPSAGHVSFTAAVQVGVPAAVILVLWIYALSSGLGYLAPTFVMQAAFLALCGVRSPLRMAIIAALVTGVSYAVFAGALSVRLPETLAPWLI